MSSYSWKIIRGENPQGLAEIKIDRSEWEDLVDNDPTLTWMDDTLQGKEFYSGPGKDNPKKVAAFFLYNESKNKAIMTFAWGFESFIYVNVAPRTKLKANKVFEIADKLNAKVYKLGREIHREKTISKV